MREENEQGRYFGLSNHGVNLAPPDEDEAADGIRNILVVDDSAAQRLTLRRLLEPHGFCVSEAASGRTALEHVEAQAVDLVVSDWMMPGMDGLALCEAFRMLDRESYGYFMLLTSKNNREDVQAAFAAGVDDFLSKPVDPSELAARIHAGDRIVRMQRALAQKNKLLTNVVDELQTLYAALDRDLDEARALQQSLVPKRQFRFPNADISFLLRPAGKVGGDLVGALPLSDKRVGLYAVDVSGHGIASALVTARVAGLLSGPTPERNLALERSEDGAVRLRRPQDTCHQLNNHLNRELETEHYLTALIADCDLESGQLTFAQAGHPSPMILKANGTVRFLGKGGMPVGLLDDPIFETVDVTLGAGDRLLIFSDGLIECAGSDGALLDPDGLAEIVIKNHDLNGGEFFEALMWDVCQFTGSRALQDDVSALMLDYRPSSRALRR